MIGGKKEYVCVSSFFVRYEKKTEEKISCHILIMPSAIKTLSKYKRMPLLQFSSFSLSCF